ncbi:MAG: bifunctional phosphoribosyl-AMP cyclohydrolase/phosphoribosyl-ATP diphosphatase HisIE [Armatimonadota bacterium]|nr:bifunctional phosphoribosyl-AMP cyclohydrolase/phosphoribosyl-ATP diphosphatase HisIE [Armatimonadota bacterium]MDR5697010.1 bifunctional phosphoribosyl-AMP cyclohydrolase/phosphoribosyl-ATP diphosphatase HisIE [Armatimonadota bacterium]
MTDREDPRVEIPQGRGPVAFDDLGLVPVVVQDRCTGAVLMLAYADAAAIARTERTGLAHFWSRSRGRPWQKGETSGHVLRVHRILTDCDGDAVLYVVDPSGPACHTGERSCFHRDLSGARGVAPAAVLADLAALVASRRAHPVEGSYTAALLSDVPSRLHAKIYEEAAEVVRAAREEGPRRLAEEAADLLYHLLVLLARHDVALSDVLDVLERRRGATGAES